MRLHTGAKPFKCPHCELRFRTSGRRKTHMQFHYKSDPKKARKPIPRSSSESLQSGNLLNSPSTDPNVFIMNNSVLTGQFDQNMLQQGLVGQAILPASVSGRKPTCALSSSSMARHSELFPRKAAGIPWGRFSAGVGGGGVAQATLVWVCGCVC